MMGWGKAEPAPLKRWVIQTVDSSSCHTIDAHFAFNNAEEGLIFRRYRDDNPESKTTVVAAFAHGYWQYFQEIPIR